MSARWAILVLAAAAALAISLSAGARRYHPAEAQAVAPAAPAAAAPAPTTSPAAEPAAPIQYAKGKVLASLAIPAAKESSGIAASRRTPGVFWTHNDSGDAARLYAFDLAGRDLGTYAIDGVNARDWEDIASFTQDGKSWLLVADTGDNDRHHAESVLYLIPEPQVDPGHPTGGRASVAMKISFSYQDGALDCEAMAVDAAAGKIYLASKNLLPICRIYELPLPTSAPTEKLIARPIGTVSVSLATGMDISPDERRMVICNYSEAVEFTRRGDESWARTFDRAPRKIALPSRRQGEAICYGLDGVTLYLTSEGQSSPIIEVKPR